MQAKHKKFIREKLIPFMLRDAGRGFVMENWCLKGLDPGQELDVDGLLRPAPKCGTVACIGGSIACLLGSRAQGLSNKIIEPLGITKKQAKGLFYEWAYDTAPEQASWTPKYGWPAKFVNAFNARTSPLGKVKVAVRLLEEVMRTNGKCLELKNG